MAASSMTASQIERFAKSMLDQGVGVTRTTKGLFLRLPDGNSTTLHFTNSDVRADQNLMSRLRRAGVRHPDDPKDVRQLTKDVTNAAPVAARSLRKVEHAVEILGYPDTVSVKDIMAVVDIVHITASRAMYQMGFKPVRGKNNARDWLVPQEILDKKPKEENWLESEKVDPEAFEQKMESPTIDEPKGLLDREVERFLKSEEREFIDEVDSWVVDLTQLPPSMTIGDYFDSLAATGLQFEVRVWRA